MKIAVVYNRQSRRVINLFGRPNQERIGMKTIQRILDALKQNKHRAIALEGDKDLIHRLEEFMPRVLKGERPGLVFNLSYGIQGEARYTHIPGILEMVGIPYVASGPLAHSLALDKVVSKTLFRQFGLPTPDFAVLNDAGFETPDLAYPLIVKPKNEAVSFGIRVVHNETELREAAGAVFDAFSQPVLVEQYIEGREINVGLIGNDPAEVFPPAEIVFDNQGPKIYTYEDKTGISGREIRVVCPAELTEKQRNEARKVALQAFSVLGCRDCARVDMRLDRNDNLFLLEINSLPSLGEHGSYTHAAEAAGLDYPRLVNRLVEVASARYFGTPRPPQISAARGDADQKIFHFLTEGRDRMENRLQEWTRINSRTTDPIGMEGARKELGRRMATLNLIAVNRLTDRRSVMTWETSAGLKGGILLVGFLDIPSHPQGPPQAFRRGPDRLYGEGIGCSRAPLVMLEFALGALRHVRKLQSLPLGILYYSDEGQDNRYSRDIIQQAAGEARQVLSLRAGLPPNAVITQRRGQIKYQLKVEGTPRRLGQAGRRLDTIRWTNRKLEQLMGLSSRKDHLAIGVIDTALQRYPLQLPHQVTVRLLMNYLDRRIAQRAEQAMRDILGREGFDWTLEKVSERPPMKERPRNQTLYRSLASIAESWEIPLQNKSSLWPSPVGLAPSRTAAICGMGPVSEDLYTPQESIRRISLMQRTLLLAQFLNFIHPGSTQRKRSSERSG